jgi:periplasmic protein TonB
MEMLFIKFSGNIVLLAICLIIAFIGLIARWYRLAYSQSVSKSYKPTAWANNSGKFFGIGLIAALVFTFLLSAWTIYDEIDRRMPRESFNIGDLLDIAKHNNTRAVLPAAPPPSAIPEVPKPPIETPEKPKVITPDTKLIVNNEPQKTQDIPSPNTNQNINSSSNNSGENTSNASNSNQGTSLEKPLQYAEDMPIFPGCESEIDALARENCTKRKLTEYVQKTVRYPELAIKNNIQGKIMISFIVEKDGSISEIKVISDKLGNGCGEASIAAVKTMNNFTKKIQAARQNGRAVRLKYTIPVTFTLNELKKGN